MARDRDSSNLDVLNQVDFRTTPTFQIDFKLQFVLWASLIKDRDNRL
jgi:hypothetical protein